MLKTKSRPGDFGESQRKHTTLFINKLFNIIFPIHKETIKSELKKTENIRKKRMK